MIFLFTISTFKDISLFKSSSPYRPAITISRLHRSASGTADRQIKLHKESQEPIRAENYNEANHFLKRGASFERLQIIFAGSHGNALSNHRGKANRLREKQSGGGLCFRGITKLRVASSQTEVRLYGLAQLRRDACDRRSKHTGGSIRVFAALRYRSGIHLY